MVERARRCGARVSHAVRWRAREGAARARRTAEIVRVARRRHPASAATLARHAIDLIARRGFSLEEAFTMDLLDPGRSPAELDRWVSKRELIRQQARINPNEFWYWTEDKAVFYRHAESLGLATPRLYGILCQPGPGWSWRGDVLADAADWARFLEDGVPEEFVIKPARGYHGLGVHVITRAGGELRGAGGERVSAADLCRRLTADGQFHTFVVQERLRNHPDLPGDGPALCTARVVTLVRRDGSVDILNAQLKVGVDGNVIDNFRGGATGNLIGAVDPLDGTMGPFFGAGPHGILEERDTSAAGRRLPLWEGVLELARRAAPLFLPMRAIGWDVAITPTGPVLVEANMWWDPPTPQSGSRAVLEALRSG